MNEAETALFSLIYAHGGLLGLLGLALLFVWLFARSGLFSMEMSIGKPRRRR
jgi:hypothetical protein